MLPSRQGKEENGSSTCGVPGLKGAIGLAVLALNRKPITERELFGSWAKHPIHEVAKLVNPKLLNDTASLATYLLQS